MKEGEENRGLASLWTDAAWVLTICGSIGWGMLAATVLPHTACTGGHWLAVGMAVQALLTVTALALTVARGARYRMSGGLVLFLLGMVALLSFPGVMMLWLGQICWHLAM